jgi:uncharacterized repeat protein (TIGR01451 family)
VIISHTNISKHREKDEMKKKATIFYILTLALVLSLGTGLAQAGAQASPGSAANQLVEAAPLSGVQLARTELAKFQGIFTTFGWQQGVNVPDCGNACAIDIRKQEEGPDSRVFVSGSDVTFEIVVTNIGQYDLVDVAVTDDQAPGCSRVIGSLAAGASVTYSCTVPTVTQGFTNTACVEGMVRNLTVTDCDPSTVEVASIDIRKQAEGPDSQVIVSGSDVTFEIVVTNTGEVDLSGVEVTDEQAPGCAHVIGDLAAGASETYSCTVPAVTQGFTNTACVEGMAGEVTVDDCDPSTVEVASIDIRKQAEGPDSRVFASGSDVTFEIVVTNTGEVDLSGVEVTDEQAPGCAHVIGDLAAGASETYSCTVPAVTQGFTNTACVEGMAGEVTVDDCDPSTVEVASIDIRKQAEGPDRRVFASGSDVTFEIVVTNNGEVDLTDVEVTDAEAPGCANVIGDLAAGASITYSCTVPMVEEGFTNNACVDGVVGDVAVDDCDSSQVKIANIFVRKQAKGQDQRSWGVQLNEPVDIPFEIEVINTGEVDLSNVVITDELVPGCAQEIGDLAVGASQSYTCSATFTFATEQEALDTTFTNVVMATGHYQEITVQDDDPSSLDFYVTSIGPIFKVYCPICMKAPVILDYTLGYEDWEAPFLDYDYNDFVTAVRTTMYYASTDYVDKIEFSFTPEARGGVFDHAFHIDFDAGTLNSSGTATLTVYDQNGIVVPSESYTQQVQPGNANRFTIFQSTAVVFPPAGAVINAIENTPRQAPQRTATLLITLDQPVLIPQSGLNYQSVGPHGAGLFFNPHLNVLDPRTGVPYEIGKGDVRTLVIPTLSYKWPEEQVLVSYAYPLVTGTPPSLVFPDFWWNSYNECVYGDGVVCPQAPTDVYEYYNRR